MKGLQEKIAYLQGQVAGMKLDKSDEGKTIAQVLEILEDVADYLEFLREQQEDLDDYLESVDSDLADIEDTVYDEDDDDDDLVEVECPNCQEVVFFDSSILYDENLIEVTCPVCETVVYVNGEEEPEDDEVNYEETNDEYDGYTKKCD